MSSLKEESSLQFALEVRQVQKVTQLIEKFTNLLPSKEKFISELITDEPDSIIIDFSWDAMENATPKDKWKTIYTLNFDNSVYIMERIIQALKKYCDTNSQETNQSNKRNLRDRLFEINLKCLPPKIRNINTRTLVYNSALGVLVYSAPFRLGPKACFSIAQLEKIFDSVIGNSSLLTIEGNDFRNPIPDPDEELFDRYEDFVINEHGESEEEYRKEILEDLIPSEDIMRDRISSSNIIAEFEKNKNNNNNNNNNMIPPDQIPPPNEKGSEKMPLVKRNPQAPPKKEGGACCCSVM